MQVKRILIVLIMICSCLIVSGCGHDKDDYYYRMNSDIESFVKYKTPEVYYDNIKLESSYSGALNEYYDVVWESKNEYMSIVDNVLKIVKYPDKSIEVTLKVTFNEVIYDIVENPSVSKEFNVLMHPKKDSLTLEFAKKNGFWIDSESETMGKSISSSVDSPDLPYRYRYKININNFTLVVEETVCSYGKYYYTDYTYDPKTGKVNYKKYSSYVDSANSETHTIDIKGKTEDEIEGLLLYRYSIQNGIKYLDNYLALIGERQYCSGLYK